MVETRYNVLKAWSKLEEARVSPNHRKSLKSDILSSFSYLFSCASSLVPSCSYPSRRAPSSLFVQVSLCFLLRTSRSNVRRTFFTGVKKGSKGSSSLANRERKKNAARVSSTVTLSGELWSVRRFRLCSIQWKRKREREEGRERERGREGGASNLTGLIIDLKNPETAPLSEYRLRGNLKMSCDPLYSACSRN